MTANFFESTTLIILLFTGVAAGFANTLAGGGSLITVPALILLGLPETVANGTSRVPIFLQSLAATLRFWREGRLPLAHVSQTSSNKGSLRVLPLALWTTFGAVVGAYLATQISNTAFRTAFGWVMLSAALLVVVNPAGRMAATAAPAARHPFVLSALLVAAGFYGGAMQAGVGYLFLSVLMFAGRLPLMEANILKVLLILAYTPFVLLIFGNASQVHVGAAVALSVGQAVGGWMGAQAALAHGASLIRAMLAIMVVVGALHLLGLF